MIVAKINSRSYDRYNAHVNNMNVITYCFSLYDNNVPALLVLLKSYLIDYTYARFTEKIMFEECKR